MHDNAAPPRPNPRFLAWWLVCALLILYASTVVGPSGPNFVPLEAADAWRAFRTRAFTWVNLGADQRADWMGNLTLYVPFGYLLAGALWPRTEAGPRRLAAAAAAGAAWALALAFVLAVKFAQLYFPPRTVMLNYVVAQGIGAAVGIAVFGVSRSFFRAHPLGQGWHRLEESRERLRLALMGYGAALCVFILMPLDFALTPHELLAQLGRLPDAVIRLPGADRSPIVQAALLLASALATVPLGLLLALGPHGRQRSLGEVNARAVVWMTALWLLSTLVLSAAPSLLTLALRVAGVALGGWGTRRLQKQDADRLLHRLRSRSAVAALPYLLLLFAVNGLLSRQWLTPSEALRSAYALGWLPLFDYYIVSKAAAAKNIVAHALMYAPIGVFAWLNGARPAVALGTASLLALLVELARYMRPGLEGDVNAVAVAGAAAFLTARAMPAVWRIVTSVVKGRQTDRKSR
jgi:VanZ family protein